MPVTSGQEAVQIIEELGIQDSTRQFIKKEEGNPIMKPRINMNGTFTIGYGFDFTKAEQPEIFDRYFTVDANNNIQIRRNLTDKEAEESIDLAVEKKGIMQAIEAFINGTGYGNTKKPLVLNQNQYDALFSYFYSNGAYVFTDDVYNSWKSLGGEYAIRADARRELRDYLIDSNGCYNKETIRRLFVNSKGGNIKYEYLGRRTDEAELFMRN